MIETPEEKGVIFFMRGTSHNGRAGKNGVYSVKHNDRNFDVDSAEHIDKDRMSGNWYWQRYRKEQDMTFDECEKRFYEENFTDSLTAKNERYKQQGHKERMKTMDEYRENRLSCPEETLLQVGKTEETIDSDLLKQICIEHINWEMKTFPNVKVLDVALHVDEEGAPHMHERKVWIAHSDDGLIVGQAKALDEMGIQRPHPEKKKDRYNNPKTTYTAMCREHFLEVCKQHGLEIELEPDKVSKRGLELTEYKRQQEQERAEQLQAQNERLTEANTQLTADNSSLQAENGSLQARNGDLSQQVIKLQDEKEKAVQGLTEALQELSDVRADTASQVQVLRDAVQKTAKPKRKGLFQKPDTVEVSKADYDDLLVTADNLTRVLYTNKAVSDDAAKAAEQERQQLEELRRTEQQKIQEEAERIAKKLIDEAVRKARSDERQKANEVIQGLQSYKAFVISSPSTQKEYRKYRIRGMPSNTASMCNQVQQQNDTQFGE